MSQSIFDKQLKLHRKRIGPKKCALGWALFSLLAMLPGSASFARFDLVPGSRFTSGRGAAMGDAYLPLGEDGPSGLFYNPADIAHVRRATVEPLNLAFSGNMDYFQTIDGNFYKVTGLQGYSPTTKNNVGYFPEISGSIFPNAAFRGLAFGLLAQTQLLSESDGTNFTYRSLYQIIPTVGTGLRIASGVLRIGYSLQWVNQASGTVTVPLATSPLAYTSGLAQGSAFSHNAGLAVTLPTEYLPSLNFVARNIGGAHYIATTLLPIASNKNGLPADDPMTFDASFSIQPRIARGAFFNWVFEMRDLTNQSGMKILGRFATGLEFSIRDIFTLRGGWGSGYPAAGFGLKSKRGEISFAWYSEEIGGAYQAKRDQKILINYQIRAF